MLYIEHDDFLEDPPKKFFRLAPGREVRLRGAYFVTCSSVVKDPSTGAVTELRCVYDPATRGGDAPDGRKVKATLHWVSAAHALDVEVRLYDRLFTTQNPGRSGDFRADLNPHRSKCSSTARSNRASGRGARHPVSVRADWILLDRSGLGTGSARVQPHGHAQGHVGED